MMGSTHVTIGALVGAAIGSACKNPVVGAAVSGLASLLPDIDNPDSKVGRRAPLLSRAVNALCGHRNITHTVFFVALCAGALVLMDREFLGLSPGYMALCAAAGILSHIALDSLTKAGTRPFEPVSHLHIKGPLRTGSLYESVFNLILVSLTIWMISRAS